MNTKHYRLSNNSFHTRGFAWATSMVPKSDVYYRKCPCGAIETYPVGAFGVVIDSGMKYPDILGCGAYPMLIVAERVVDIWRSTTRGGFLIYPVDIAEVRSKSLKAVTPPRYYRVEVEGRCEIDLGASGGVLLHQCECHHLITEPPMLDRFIMQPGSWDGSDLFRDHDLYPRVTFCTEKVMEIASEHRLTNFRFEPMQGPFDYASKGIDYLHGKRS